MADPTLNDVIGDLVDDKINQIPYPEKCTITKVYDDNKHIDIKLKDDAVLTYVEAIGNNLTVGNTGVVIYLNGGFDECIIITK